MALVAALAVSAAGAAALVASVFLELYSFAGAPVSSWDGYIRMDKALLAAGGAAVALAAAAFVAPRPLLLLALAACGLVPLGHASFVLLELPVENGPGLWAEIGGSLAIATGAALGFTAANGGRSRRTR